MALFGHREFAGHERVIHVHDADVGLRAIVAIHDRSLGPAVGGCRIFPYADEDQALADVLRLSRGMTYKTALAGLPFGGAKSVIIADPSDKGPDLFRSFAAAINALNGDYWTGEDVNCGAADVEVLARFTPYVLGRSVGADKSGDPSPHTAAGVFSAMQAALGHVDGCRDVAGRRIAIQGAGNVGRNLARLVSEAGGSVILADVRAESAEQAAAETGAELVHPDEIYQQDCDVFAPCAMGSTVNEETVGCLKARIICGAANNQLSSPEIGRLLLRRKIAYVPDYVANAGGIINAAGEYQGHYDPEAARRRIGEIGSTTARILDVADREQRPSSEVADEMAEAILARARLSRLQSETS